MKGIIGRRRTRETIHWLLAALVVLYLVTGFDITQFRTVETLTFGLLTKNIAFHIHSNLWIPLLVLLSLHIYLSLAGRWQKPDAQPGRREYNRV